MKLKLSKIFEMFYGGDWYESQEDYEEEGDEEPDTGNLADRPWHSVDKSGAISKMMEPVNSRHDPHADFSNSLEKDSETYNISHPKKVFDLPPKEPRDSFAYRNIKVPPNAKSIVNFLPNYDEPWDQTRPTSIK